MKHSRIVLAAAALLVAAAVLPASAFDCTPVQIGIAGEAFQLFPNETDVMGLRINLPVSQNDTVTGIDLGFVSLGADFQAIRANLYNTSDYRFCGVEAGLVNRDVSLAGLAVAPFNLVSGDASAIQVGLFNHANFMTGMQIGVFNHANSLRGLQIGLINLIEDGPLTFFPVINMAF